MAKYDIKQSMMVRHNGEVFTIKAGEKQDIPSELLSHWIVVAAIKSGNVATSGAKKIVSPVKEDDKKGLKLAKEEASKIVAAAQEEASKIVAAAQEEAEKIKITAKEEAEMFGKLAEEEASKIVAAAKEEGSNKKKGKE